MEAHRCLPIEENNDFEFDLEKCKSILAKGSELNIETSKGRCMVRSVSIVLTIEGKVIIKIRKLNLLNAFASKKENSSEGDESDQTCYLIVLTTNGGMIKLDMMDDYQRYKMWALTINHMLMQSTSFTKYELQFHKN
ncbi:hypothetical protein HYC85_003902 [Camellia sinensis]|uniref:Pleckstrin-like plant domain-containing protein n=1 Tax=Camellia sinensis TaxID=4442 RepID=A0A7J7HW79_CAMSI|nr:hypothetical protein HYC85_003902 [Camellia sinensis]